MSSHGLRPLARGARLLSLFQPVGNRGDNAFSDLILHNEKIADLTIRPLGPYVRTSLGVDKLRNNADTSSNPADATFQNILDAQLSPNLLYGHGPAFEGE